MKHSQASALSQSDADTNKNTKATNRVTNTIPVKPHQNEQTQKPSNATKQTNKPNQRTNPPQANTQTSKRTIKQTNIRRTNRQHPHTHRSHRRVARFRRRASSIHCAGQRNPQMLAPKNSCQPRSTRGCAPRVWPSTFHKRHALSVGLQKLQ